MGGFVKLVWFVPESHLEVTKQAAFAAGAGRLGCYDQCCFQVQGQGQFRPLTGNHAYLGATGQLETVAEWRVEVLCADTDLAAVLAALRRAHPYEEPAIDVFRLEDTALPT